MKCPECSAEYDDSFSYCPYCRPVTKYIKTIEEEHNIPDKQTKPNTVGTKYKVGYLGGLVDLPKKKTGFIDLLLTPESFILRSIMKWWTETEIAYGDVTDFEIVGCIVGSVRAILVSRQSSSVG